MALAFDGPICEAKLLNDRISELRNHYCYQEKCGFDQVLEPDFINLETEKFILDKLELKNNQLIKANQTQQDITDLEKNYGINFEKNALHDKNNFKSFLDKACLFSQYIDDNANNNFQYQSCQSAIIDHRIQQLSLDDDADTSSTLSDFANIGKISQKGDWLFGCDQDFSCTAIGYPNIKNTIDKGQYIAIRWQFNYGKPPLIRFIVASDDPQMNGIEFNYQFSNPSLKFKLINDSAHPPVIFEAHIDDKDSANFMKALLSEKQLTFGVDLKELPRAHISLKEFANFYNKQQQNTQLLYGKETPSLTTLHALSLKVQSYVPQGDPSTSNCQSSNKPILNIQLDDKQNFIASCEDIASNNNGFYRLDKRTETGMLSAQFDGKAHLLGQNWLFDPVLEKGDLELVSRQIFSANNDCGRLYRFAYNGKVWQLSTVRAMPFCALIQQKDWPQLYTTNLDEHEPLLWK